MHSSARRLVGLTVAWVALTACGPSAPESAAEDPAVAQPAAQAASEPERLLLITVDTLRADHVGCYGSELASTPTMDALAADGVRFATAISPAPLTAPSHATILTGLDPPRHGVRHNGVYQLDGAIPTLAERFAEAGFETAAFPSAPVLRQETGIGRGFMLYDDALGLADVSHGGMVVPSRRGDHTVDAIVAWLEDAGDRVFVWGHFYDPHAVYAAPEPFHSRFAGEPYLGEIAFVDAEIQRLLDAVETRWPAGGTVVLVTSDHGESLGEHGERTHSYTVYDATQRVPLILSGPGLPAGGVVEAPVRLTDLAPTLLDLFGLPAFEQADGRSLLPLVSGEDLPDAPALVETLATQLDMGWSPLLGVRTATHKYIRAPRPELYALARDPEETRNLVSEEPELAARLDALVVASFEGQRSDPNRRIDETERLQLQALGYLVDEDNETDALGVVGGIDPKDELPLMETMHRANQLVMERRGREALEVLAPLHDRGRYVQELRVNAALIAGNDAVAREATDRVLSLSADARAWSIAGLTHEAAHRDAEARDAFLRSLEIDPDQASSHTGLGRLAERAGEREAARAHYERASAAASPKAESTWRLAALEIEAGERDRARARLLDLDSSHLTQEPAASRLARAEFVAGRPEIALARLNGAVKRFPLATGPLLQKAMLLDEMGRADQALAARLRAHALAPGDPLVRNAVAWSLAMTGGDLEIALEHAIAAADAFDGNPVVLDTVALVRTLRGEFALALTAADAGLETTAGSEVHGMLLYRRAEALAGLRDDGFPLALQEARGASVDTKQALRAEKRIRRIWPEAPLAATGSS